MTDRTAAAKKAWETIRARQAAKAAGLPVPESRAPKTPEKNYASLISAWLAAPKPQEPQPAASHVATIARQPKPARKQARRVKVAPKASKRRKAA